MHLLKLKFNKVVTIIIIIFFILIKLPHLGFSYQHYIRGLLTVYPETLAIFFFLVCIYFLFNKKYFLSGLFCALMVFLRPNYFPAFLAINLFNFIISLKEKNIQRLIYFLLGSSFIFVMLIHNYVFGEKAFIPFVNNHGISRLFVHPYDYIYVFKEFENLSIISNHLLNLLTTGKNNIIVITINSFFLLNLFYFYLFNFKKINNYAVLFCFISIIQIMPSLFYINTNRYSYFLWFLITISNLLIFKHYYYKFRKSNSLML